MLGTYEVAILTLLLCGLGLVPLVALFWLAREIHRLRQRLQDLEVALQRHKEK